MIGACASQTEAQTETAQTLPASTTTVTIETPNPAPVTVEMTQAEKFAAWKADFTNRAIAKGYGANLVRGLIEPTKINEKALDRDASQPEFSKPIWSYVEGAASADRLNQGRAKLASESGLFGQIEDRYKVSRHYLTAIWGLESAYGKILGDFDIIDALATFAHDGRRSDFGENQLFAILDMLSRGDVRRDQLRGSWAGAMGMTQFIPTTMRDYAVDFDQNANIDLRGSKADALGSAAHYLSRHGWRWGEPAMAEVQLANGFDYSLSDGTRKTVNDWTVLGVRPMGEQRWS
ncbi:MAG: lytic murein transglycosylase, partial [Hellea sp.]|nr:lytic murein transglycosylase [Hellea sp.]